MSPKGSDGAGRLHFGGIPDSPGAMRSGFITSQPSLSHSVQAEPQLILTPISELIGPGASIQPEANK